MSDTTTRGIVTVVVWLSYLGILWVALPQLGAWVALLAFVLMMAVIPIVMAMWGIFGETSSSKSRKDMDYAATSSTEKRKRERLDAVLRDLSDDDLILLRRRLQGGVIDDNILYEQIVGDDGELVDRR